MNDIDENIRHIMNPDTTETSIKKEIQTRMERVVPSYALFTATMHSVTKEQSKRSTYMKAVPSPYHSFISHISGRGPKIAMTVVLTVFIAVLAIKTGNQGVLPFIHTPSESAPPLAVSTSASDDQSPDQIVATLMDDADTEGMLGASEEEDGTVLTEDQDLQDYTVI